MSIKKIGRSVLLLAVTAATCVLPLSGCVIKTSHPEATITISFDGETYALKYKLYRNLYPQTVQHFIELADSGFYDNTIIHDYQTSYWYGGGYSYVEGTDENDESGYVASFKNGAMADYLTNNSKEEAYNTLAITSLTPSVYKSYSNGQYTEPLTTLIGEFSANKHTVENGAITGGFGNLRMYYSSKSTDAEVYTKKENNEDKVIIAPYKYNSATSIFSIQVGTSTSTDSTHCVFGVMIDTDVLEDLQEAITDWRDDSDYTSSTFAPSSSIDIDNYDAIVGAKVNTGSYKATAEPIIVKSVKITKY
jgi:cyclophilin family peptidyl-prolyl cis-trans isomerase